MGVFGKEDEYMDYTLLKKKGILKLKKEETLKNTKMEGGFLDLTSMRNEPSSSEQSNSSNTTMPNNFGFLADMASAGLNSQSNQTSFDNNLKIDEKEFNMLKVKIDDIDYKIDRFIERIDRLEEKLARFG